MRPARCRSCAAGWPRCCAREGVVAGSHDDRDLVDLFNSFPREELLRQPRRGHRTTRCAPSRAPSRRGGIDLLLPGRRRRARPVRHRPAAAGALLDRAARRAHPARRGAPSRGPMPARAPGPRRSHRRAPALPCRRPSRRRSAQPRARPRCAPSWRRCCAPGTTSSPRRSRPCARRAETRAAGGPLRARVPGRVQGQHRDRCRGARRRRAWRPCAPAARRRSSSARRVARARRRAQALPRQRDAGAERVRAGARESRPARARQDVIELKHAGAGERVDIHASRSSAAGAAGSTPSASAPSPGRRAARRARPAAENDPLNRLVLDRRARLARGRRCCAPTSSTPVRPASARGRR